MIATIDIDLPFTGSWPPDHPARPGVTLRRDRCLCAAGLAVVESWDSTTGGSASPNALGGLVPPVCPRAENRSGKAEGRPLERPSIA